MSSSIERWLPVAGYEGLYEVSDQGRVRSLPRLATCGRYQGKRRVPGGVMSGSRHAFGYSMVILCAGDGTRKCYTVHGLVLTAFVGPRPEGAECRHLDGDPRNSRLSNLAWGSHRENEADKWEHGTRGVGSRSTAPKLTEADVVAIRKDQRTQREIAKAYGITQSNVSCIKLRKSWKHVA